MTELSRGKLIGSRLRSSVISVAAGWAAAMAATLPMLLVKITESTVGGRHNLLWSLGAGVLIWGAWTIQIVGGGWLLGLLPVIAIVPERWLLKHRRLSAALAGLCGWTVVLVQFEVWKLLLPFHSLEVRMFILYSLLLIVFPLVSALVYLHRIAPVRQD